MMHSGLVSVTFRSLTPRAIVDLVAKAGLDGIEWGGDVHVPHGNLEVAREVYAMTVDAGLRVASYGSYYHVGRKEEIPFESVVDTALELHAPTIRVWAGNRGSADADEKYRDEIVEASRRIADSAQRAGMTISYEFHGATLTDTNESALDLLRRAAHDHIKAYWQPPVGEEIDYCLAGLKNLLPYLTNVHAYHETTPPPALQTLAEGAEVWGRYLPVITSTGRDHFVMIEFVKDDEPSMFLQDATTLKGWLGAVHSNG